MSSCSTCSSNASCATAQEGAFCTRTKIRSAVRITSRTKIRSAVRITSALWLLSAVLIAALSLTGCAKPAPIGEINNQATLAVMQFEKIDQDFSGVVYREINDFAAFLAQTETPVLVALYHPLSANNAQIIPFLEQMADDQQGRLTIVWVDGTVETKIASDFGAETLPRFSILVHSEMKRTLIGFETNGPTALKALIEPYLE